MTDVAWLVVMAAATRFTAVGGGGGGMVKVDLEGRGAAFKPHFSSL